MCFVYLYKAAQNMFVQSTAYRNEWIPCDSQPPLTFLLLISPLTQTLVGLSPQRYPCPTWTLLSPYSKPSYQTETTPPAAPAAGACRTQLALPGPVSDAQVRHWYLDCTWTSISPGWGSSKSDTKPQPDTRQRFLAKGGLAPLGDNPNSCPAGPRTAEPFS